MDQFWIGLTQSCIYTKYRDLVQDKILLEFTKVKLTILLSLIIYRNN